MSPRRLFILVIALIISAVIFQNCSRLSLIKVDNLQAYQAPTLSLKAAMCDESRAASANSGKFVFVVDMSASNIGSFVLDKVRNNNYWDPSLATDLDGTRFDAIDAFLDSFTGSAEKQFAIIGFSNDAGILDSATSKWTRQGLIFTTAQEAKIQLNNLRELQKFNFSWFEKWDIKTGIGLREFPIPDNILMQYTSYTSAMGAAEDLILGDLLSPNSIGNSYRIFFMSDGEPQDKPGFGGCTGAVDLTKCYTDASLSSMTLMGAASLARGRSLKINGIFYTKDAKPNTAVLDSISKEGGTGSAIQLTDFKTQKDILIKLASASSSLDIRPDAMQVYVLTTIRKNHKIYADSDMDGIPDIEEIESGSDPQNPRSKVEGVLDGICMRLGGFEKCQKLKDQLPVKCDPNKFNKLFLTDCDYRILGLDRLMDSSDNTTDWGIDSDKDGIPDFVEIIKGLNPAVADANFDFDGDGTSNLEELLAGRDPFTPDANIPLTQLNQISTKFNTESFSSCVNGYWELSLDRMQVLKTYAVGNLSSNQINHEANQHVVLFNYRKSAINSTQAVWEIQSRAVKIGYEVKNNQEILSIQEPKLAPTDFDESGKVKK